MSEPDAATRQGANRDTNHGADHGAAPGTMTDPTAPRPESRFSALSQTFAA